MYQLLLGKRDAWAYYDGVFKEKFHEFIGSNEKAMAEAWIKELKALQTWDGGYDKSLNTLIREAELIIKKPWYRYAFEKFIEGIKEEYEKQEKNREGKGEFSYANILRLILGKEIKKYGRDMQLNISLEHEMFLINKREKRWKRHEKVWTQPAIWDDISDDDWENINFIKEMYLLTGDERLLEGEIWLRLRRGHFSKDSFLFH